MRGRYLEVTFRKGRAIAAYLYLPRRGAERAARVSKATPGLLIDYNADGKAIGIEITAPGKLRVAALNRVLTRLGQPRLGPEELAPLLAAVVRAKDELLAAIDREQALIGRLEREREEAQARVRSLQAQLSTPAEDVDGSVSLPPPSTAGQKVALFRGLFRGRDDVFAKLWVNPRTDRKGYAPARANEWVRGVCEKPRVKCSECPNQAFISVSDQVVLDHLQGRHVIGVYPLLEDDTCWFLAADFDEESWADDVAAFVETSRTLGLSAAVERSRSGNGAHVWFFFAAPVPAATARRMSCYLITETMSRRHQLAMASYDRLFPNQDMLPRGGFGNLIALPLQHEARERGNTVFVDDRLVPHADQWAYLASLSRIAPTTVDAIAREAVARGQVIGLRIASTGEDEDETPWEAPPSRRPRPARIEEPLPSEVRAVLAQRIFVEKARLPSAFLNQIKRRGLPEPGVLQAAEDAAVDGAHAACRRVCRGALATRCSPARLRRRLEGPARRPRSWPPARRSTRPR